MFDPYDPLFEDDSIIEEPYFVEEPQQEEDEFTELDFQHDGR